MTRSTAYFIILIFLLLIIGGVGAFLWSNTTLLHPISCNEFIDSSLGSVYTKPQAESELDWINEHFIIGRSTAQKVNDYLDSGFVRWTWNTLDKNYELRVTGSPYQLKQSWKYSVATINDMVNCLGAPDVYLNAAEYGPDASLQVISFFYLKDNLVVSGRRFITANAWQINGQTKLVYVYFLPTNHIDEMIDNIYDYVSKAAQQDLLNSVQMWPGDIGKINQTPHFFNPN